MAHTTKLPKVSRLVTSVALLAILVLLGIAPTAALAEEAEHVYIYAITDFHGHVEEGGKVAGMLDEVRE